MRTLRTHKSENPNQLRRKLFRGASGGVGVLLAVQAKTALGTAICQSPSAMMSGNTSPRPGGPVSCTGGRSPGFWKVPQKFNYWSGATPATFSKPVSICTNGMQGLHMSDILTEGTLLSSVFPGSPSSHGLWAVLAFPTHADFGGQGQLLRHLTAAYLNSKYPSWSGPYPILTSQVIDMWTQLKSCSLYNPTVTSGCATTGMTASDVIAYISNMYDIAADIPPDADLCKP
jgi:hypothetical protein